MSTSSSVVSRVEITAKSKAESETIEKYIRINHLRFGPEFQAAPESELGNTLTYQSTGLPYLKNGSPWEYPYLRILIQFTDAYIEIHYPSEGETKSTSFGRPIAPEARSVVKIRPSDLTFLLQCPKCFYMKYNFGFTQPFVSVSGGMARGVGTNRRTHQ
jgi:hypothetical protein